MFVFNSEQMHVIFLKNEIDLFSDSGTERTLMFFS